MTLHDQTPRLTYNDYVLFADDGMRHEIVAGEHLVTTAPLVRHQKLVVRLTLLLGRFIEEHRLGHLLVAPTDVVLSLYDVVQPDLLFISNDRAFILQEKNVQGAPDLIIEILSEATRGLDTGAKHHTTYEHFGVQEYWLVDPHRQSVEVWTRTGESFCSKPTDSEKEDSLTTPLLPGLEIIVAEIFSI